MRSEGIGHGSWVIGHSPGRGGAGVRLAYNTGLALLLPVIAGYYAYRSRVRKKPSARWSDRMGLFPAEAELGRLPNERVIWLHAVSVGEVAAAQPILRELMSRELPLRIFLSVITPTGYEMARSRLPKMAGLFYLPFDFPACVHEALARLMPDVLVLMETELWPNLLSEARGLGIRTLLVNGRISDRSFDRARRVRPLFRWMLGNLDALCMQTDLDRTRVEALGAPPHRARVTGNSKFDEPFPVMTAEDCADLRALLGFCPQDQVLVFGSTGVGEEPTLLDAYGAVRLRHPDVRLVLVPRHPERVPEIAQWIHERGFDYCLRSQLGGSPPGNWALPRQDGPSECAQERARGKPPGQVGAPAPGRATGVRAGARHSPAGLPACRAADTGAPPPDCDAPRQDRIVLVDTIGELSRLYAIAEVAFLGRSLVPLGGGNLLQPLAFGKPVLFGPHMQNFKEATQMVLDAGVGFCVADGADLAARISQLLDDPGRLQRIGEEAKRLLAENRGAAERYAEAILAALEPKNGTDKERLETRND